MILVFLIAFLFTGNFVDAQQGPCQAYCTELREGGTPLQPSEAACICNPLQTEDLAGIVDNVLTVLFNFALVLTPLMIVIAGIMFVTAGGSPERVSTAKRILLWTAVGFVIILLARGLVVVIGAIIGF